MRQCCIVAAFFCFLVFDWSVFAGPPVVDLVTLSGVLRSGLPSVLKQIEPGKTTRDQVLQNLGKPSKQRGAEVFFYHLAGRDFDTTIAFRGKLVRYVRHEPWPMKQSLKDLKSWISDREIQAARAEAMKKPVTADRGQSFVMTFLKEAVKLTVRSTDKLWITAILFWEPGRKAP